MIEYEIAIFQNYMSEFLSRRDFLIGLAASTAAVGLSACDGGTENSVSGASAGDGEGEYVCQDAYPGAGATMILDDYGEPASTPVNIKDGITGETRYEGPGVNAPGLNIVQRRDISGNQLGNPVSDVVCFNDKP